MTLFFIHTPTSLSNAMGMIAAVLLGQFAIDLGIFSEEILLFCAIGDGTKYIDIKTALQRIRRINVPIIGV